MILVKQTFSETLRLFVVFQLFLFYIRDIKKMSFGKAKLPCVDIKFAFLDITFRSKLAKI